MIQQQQQQQQQQQPQAAVAPSAPAVNGNHTNQNSMYNNAHGGSSHSTTTTVNSSGNSISRPNNGVAINGSETPVAQLPSLHDVSVEVEWTAEEQATLDEGLIKYGAETSTFTKYIKIANNLTEKTVRDVALRCRWMMIQKKDLGKRRKAEEQSANKKSKEKKDKSDTTSNKVSQNHTRTGAVPSYSAPQPPVDNEDCISNDAIGGTTGQLLEQNSQIIIQIRSNLAACKLTENTEHLVRFRDNIFAILNGMTNMPGIMSQMPPLPVKLNVELADSILPKSLQAPPSSQ